MSNVWAPIIIAWLAGMALAGIVLAAVAWVFRGITKAVRLGGSVK